ncbi:MAG: hypothetical protein ACN4GR_03570 [Arenicellales bacterium]
MSEHVTDSRNIARYSLFQALTNQTSGNTGRRDITQATFETLIETGNFILFPEIAIEVKITHRGHTHPGTPVYPESRKQGEYNVLMIMFIIRYHSYFIVFL